MLIVLFCLDGVTEVARPRPYREGLRSHLIKKVPYLHIVVKRNKLGIGNFYPLNSRSRQTTIAQKRNSS